MEDQKFIESDLTFSFDQDWVVKKYDEHSYYRSLSGHGLKGVDFIGIYQERMLYLIEVKNYCRRSYSPVDPDWSDLKGEVPPLESIFREKIGDSRRLIKVVVAYLSTKWWYRLFLQIYSFIGFKNISKDWKFWTVANMLCENSHSIQPILWLELDPDFLKNQETTEEEYIKKLELVVSSRSLNETSPTVVCSLRTKQSKLTPLPGLKVRKNYTSE